MWLFNAFLYNICRLFTRRIENLWVFGACNGLKYDDNARHFFEYVCKEHGNEVKAVWISRKRNVVEQVRILGYEAYTTNSLKGMAIMLRAGTAIYTHGLSDYGYVPLTGGARIVSLWHGVGFKQIYNDNYHGVWLKVKLMMDCVFSWTYRDITLATSQYTKAQFKRIFNLKDDDIYITGQPRCDILRIPHDKNSIVNKFGINSNRRIILYMPTYRGKALGDNAMKKIVEQLYHSKELDETLTITHSIMVVKLHPQTPSIELPRRDNFIILDYDAIESNEELLVVSDIMITDYSSSFVDYALLNRPIIFYTPDEKKFLQYSEQLDKEYYEISSLNKATDIDELRTKITCPCNVVAKVTNVLFMSPKILNATSFSENVYKVLCNEKK